MLSKSLAESSSGERYFRWRGGDVSRLEGLSDGVFAFAATLLVVSLQVPETFVELKEAFKQLPVFAVCFTLLMYVWYAHFQFHRRYGLENVLTTWMNGALLFLVLFYVYPLKWMFRFLHVMVTGHGGWHLRDSAGQAVLDAAGQPIPIILGQDVPTLLGLYSAGFASIFLLLFAMTLYARRQRGWLALTRTELAVTDATLFSHGISATFGLASIAVAPLSPSWAGLLYFGLGPAQGISGWRWGRRIERLAAQEALPARARSPIAGEASPAGP